MEFKDYYATLGVAKTAAHDDIKRAYRKLARKYHPDVSKEPDAEARFKELAEAHEALIDPERRAAYDNIAERHARGQPFEPPPGWDTGYEFSGRGSGGGQGRRPPQGDADTDYSDFFESLFGRSGFGRGGGAGATRRGPTVAAGTDHHAKLAVELMDACMGAQRVFSLRTPMADGQGRSVLQERQLEVRIPKGVREGQHLRLGGQGGAGLGGAPAGDLYLEIEFLPHRVFRVDGGDLFFDLPVAPWEAALGAVVTAPTPEGPVALNVPAGSVQGRKLRLKGKGLPGKVVGDLYAVLTLVQPAAASDADQAAYRALAAAFTAFDVAVRVLTPRA